MSHKALAPLCAVVLSTTLTACVNYTQIRTGEPDPGVPRAMLKATKAIDANGNDSAMDACRVDQPSSTPAPTGAAATAVPVSPTACYYTLKGLIDYRYQQYKTNLFHAANDGNLTGDVLALGLTTAGSITPGATAVRLFSALAAGVLGIKSFVNEDVLYKQTITLIMGEMDSDRATVAARNDQHLQMSGYSIPMAVDDMLAYYEAGTFQHALTALQAKVSQAPAAPVASVQVVVTIAPFPGGQTFPAAKSFTIAATIGGTPINPTYTSGKTDFAPQVASGLADSAEFIRAGVTATPDPNGGGTITLTYSTSSTVTWTPGGDEKAYISVGPQTAAAQAPAVTPPTPPAVPPPNK